MANLSLLWNNQSDAATLSGGSWQTALPLANIQDKRLRKVARSTALTLASTQLTVDLNGSGHFYRAVALLSHNLSIMAKVRLRCANDAAMTAPVYDSGWRDAYEYTIPSTETQWENDNWWTGKPSQSELAGYSLNTTFVLPYLIDQRYLRLEIDDSGNSAGYIDIGRLLVAPLTELLVNINYGASLAWLDKSGISESLGGVEYADIKPKKRQFSCAAQWLGDSEALAGVFELQKSLGITGEVFVMPNRDDLANGFRTAFLARMTSLSGIEQWAAGLHKTSYQFQELL